MDFDNYLHRPIAPGTEFNNLIPKPKYNKVLIGEGSTDYSIEEMAKLVKESSHEAEALAHYLKESSLTNCIANIKDFAFNHFQYQADDADQMLRSLAYSWWVDRQNGIDCKSYSILVSSILTEMGINHYIRKIKQPGFAPTEYTHVYVVVPFDQQTNNLQNGYYTIDGTLETDKEPAYVGTKDKFMSGLQHYKLNAPVPLNGIDFSAIESKLKSLDFTSVSGFINSIKCFGGSAYTPELFDANIAKTIAFFNEVVKSINKSIGTKDFKILSNDYADFRGYSLALYEGQNLVDAYGDWNPCTTKNLQAYKAFMLFYLQTVYPALTAYLDKYFTKKEVASHHYTNNGLEGQGWTFMEEYGYDYNIDVPVYEFTIKPEVNTIPAFEFTQPIVDAVNNPFNLQKFLNSLTSTILVVKAVTNPNGNNNSGGSGTNDNIIYNADGSYTQNGVKYDSNGKVIAQTAGFGWIAGILIVFAAYKLATTANKSKTTKTT